MSLCIYLCKYECNACGAEEGFASPGFEDTVGCELPIEVLCKVRVWP